MKGLIEQCDIVYDWLVAHDADKSDLWKWGKSCADGELRANVI